MLPYRFTYPTNLELEERLRNYESTITAQSVVLPVVNSLTTYQTAIDSANSEPNSIFEVFWNANVTVTELITHPANLVLVRLNDAKFIKGAGGGLIFSGRGFDSETLLSSKPVFLRF